MSIKDFRLWALMFFVAMLVMLCAPVWATGKDNDNSVRVDNEVTVGGSTVSVGGSDTSISTGGNKSLAFAHGMGDVDINQCMGSTQWSTILVSKQKLAPNLWCMAESYDARGLYRMAAFMRCDIDMVRQHFETDEECWDANTIYPQPVEQPASVSDEDEEIHRQQEYQVSVLQAQLAELQALVEKAQRPVVRREVVEKGLTPEQKALLREVVK